MSLELLIDPEPRERVGRRLVEERLHRLDFEEFHVINEQFEGHLEGNILRRRASWRFGNTRTEMGSAF